MLRHSLGLLVGSLVTPLLWGGTAWSATEIGARLPGLETDDPILLSAVAVIMAIGLACGLLAGSRISPLAAFLPGAALLGMSLWPLMDYAALNASLPGWLGEGSPLHPVGPALPVNLALGTLLFISALAPSRWQAKPGAHPDAPSPPPRPTAEWEPEGGRPVAGASSGTTIPFRRRPDGTPTAAREPSGTTEASQTRVFRDDQ